jgi:hypothetical protein
LKAVVQNDSNTLYQVVTSSSLTAS